jgi:hypothetical protein
MGLSPHQFWRLSVAEWAALAGAARGAAPQEPRLSLAEAERLAALYPDD